ncbi:MAG TPA: serine hydrolase domain-containing protein [Gemmatimonadaceae bacterium]|nr:serine hydrolase domain-containing protein [Gemmatimonadaceae bacterium]
MTSSLARATLPFLAAATVVPSLALAQRPDSARVARYVDSVGRLVVERGRAPGLAVAVFSRGRLVVARGFGLAVLDSAQPVTDTTVFRIASVTKEFTAAAILQLAERGTLSLDDPLRKWMPGWHPDAGVITIRHLLSHTSGIVDVPYGSATARPVRLELARDFHDSLLAWPRADTLRFRPGTSWQYSNAGYQLLGRIIERASGQSYAAYVREHLLQPLGLRHTTYCTSSTHAPAHATGYSLDSTGRAVEAERIDMEGPYSAGSLCSTVRDLIAWAAALQSGRVVSRASYARMIAPRTFALDREQYGFGVQLASLEGHASVSHDGAITGFGSRLASYPRDSLIVAVLGNTTAFVAAPLERQIAAFALGLPDPAPLDVPIAAADTTPVVGRFRARGFGFTLTVRASADGLTGELPGLGRFRLRRQSDREYVSADDHYLRFRFVGNGARFGVIELSEPGHAATLDRVP